MTWIDRAVALVGRQPAVEACDEASICLVVAQAAPAAEQLRTALAASLPTSRSHVVVLGDGALDHARLAAVGPFDVLLDSARGGGARRRLRELVPHVRPGGSVVVRRTTQFDDGFDTVADDVSGPWGELVGEVRVGPQFVVVRVAARALTKLVEADMPAYLAAAGPPAGAVLAEVAAQPWTTRGEVTGNDADRVAALPHAFEGDPLALRLHEEAECHLQAATVHRGVALPDSFRRQHRAELTNHRLVGVARRAVLAPPPPRHRLEGTYLHLDNEWRGKFGHHLLEQVSRTWAWPHVLEAYPDARVLVSRRPKSPIAAWELAMLEAAGVPADRLTVIDEPTTVERLLTATPAFALPDRVHPVLADVYAAVGAALAQAAAPALPEGRPARIFLSRRTTRRRSCTNAPEVEALFVEHGFEVLYPEDHPLAEQVALVRAADVIGGFTGSGLYHLGLAGGPKRVVAIGSASYGAVVEPCLAALMGHRLHQVWCDPVDDSGFQADFTFDAARDGEGLRAALAGDGA